MATESQRDKLKNISVEEVNDSYQKGAITQGRKNEILRRKAHIAMEDMQINTLGDYLGGYWSKMIEQGNDGWDRLIESSKKAGTTRDITGLLNLLHTLSAAWGLAQVITAPLSALEDMNAEMVRRLALTAGASPGWARMIGFAAGAATGMVGQGAAIKGVGAAAKGAAKGGWLGQTLKEFMTKVPSTQGELPFVAEKVGEVFENVLKPGMTKEAVMQATLEKLQGSLGKELDAKAKAFIKDHVENWMKIQEGQMELPIQALVAGLEAEGVKVAPILEKMLSLAKPTEAATKAANAAREAGSQFILDVAHYAKGISIEQAKKEIPALARRLGINYENIKNVTPGGFYDPKNLWYENPKKMYGYLKALEPHIANINSLAKEVVESGSEAAQGAFARYMTTLFTTDPEGKVHYTKGFMNMLAHWAPEEIAAGNIPAALNTFARDMASLNPKQIGGMVSTVQMGINPAQIAQVWPMIKRTFLNTLLPLSWLPAFAGNMIGTGAAVTERAVGAMFGTATHGFNWREPYWMVKGLTMASGDAWRAVINTYKRPPAAIGRFGFNPSPIPGTPGRIIDLPMNTVQAVDNFWSVLVTRASHYAVAGREGVNLGLRGGALGAHINNRVANPTREMILEAKNLAEHVTFQNQLSKFWSTVQGASQYGVGTLWFPFMKSAINLGAWTWHRTPGLQLISTQLYKDIAAGGPAADAAIARILIAHTMASFFSEMVKEDYITGYGPVDAAQRRTWLTTHQPYSVRTSKGWVSYAQLQPLSGPIGMVADFTYIMDQLSPADAEQTAMAISFAFMHNIAQNTWWSGAERLMDVLQETESGKGLSRKGLEALLAPTVAPFSFPGRVTQVLDPLQRDARNHLDYVQSKIYPYSKDVVVKRDGFGDPTTVPEAWGHSWFGLMRPVVPAFQPYQTDRVKKEFDKYQAKTPYFSDTVGGPQPLDGSLLPVRPEDTVGVPLSPQERDKRIQIYRQMLRHPEIGIEAALLDNPDTDYKKANDTGKRMRLEKFAAQYWRNAGDALVASDPKIAQRLMDARKKKALAPLSEPQRSEVEADINEGVKTLMEELPGIQENLDRWGFLDQQPETATTGPTVGPLTIYSPPQPRESLMEPKINISGEQK